MTGSTRGVGAEIARQFTDEGAAIVVTGRSAAGGEAVVKSIRQINGDVIFIQTGMQSPDDIATLLGAKNKEFSGIDILINNAGIQTETAVEASISDLENVPQTDFRSYWLCAKHSVKMMSTGSIVNISSNHAFSTMPSHFPYNAVKAGINGMTRAMALDFGPDIRVNTINSGWIAVDRTIIEMSAEDRQELKSIHPVGRIGTPEDVATTAAFPASDEAAFITGTSLLVDGGRPAVVQ